MIAKYEKRGKYLQILHEATCDNYYIVKCLLKSNVATGATLITAAILLIPILKLVIPLQTYIFNLDGETTLENVFSGSWHNLDGACAFTKICFPT